MALLFLSTLLLLSILTLSSICAEPDSCTEVANPVSCLTKLFVDCPTTCGTILRPAYTSFGGRASQGMADFYDIRIQDIHGKTTTMEKCDGILTLILALPKHANDDFATYHYDLLNQLQGIYRWTLEVIMVTPVHFETSVLSKVTVLLQQQQDFSVLKYLVNLIQKGKYDEENLNAFLLSPNGDDLQMHIWPEVMKLRRYIDSFLDDLDKEL
jgi:hypothetical protein